MGSLVIRVDSKKKFLKHLSLQYSVPTTRLNRAGRWGFWTQFFDPDVAASIYWAVRSKVAIERNLNDEGIGVVLVRTSCVACDRIWCLFVERHLARDKARRQSGSRVNDLQSQTLVKREEIYHSIKEVATKFFDDPKVLKPSIEAVTVAQVTPRFSTTKKRFRCTSSAPDFPLAEAKKRKVD